MKPPTKTCEVYVDKRTEEKVLYPNILLNGGKDIETEEDNFGGCYTIQYYTPDLEIRDSRKSLIRIYHCFQDRCKNERIDFVICMDKDHHKEGHYSTYHSLQGKYFF